MKAPIFIFSLPRSGSTLLQRVLMSHDKIASISEPWILLPFCYATKKKGIFSEYNQSLASSAINNFKYNLPNKEKDYFQALSQMFSTLYAKQCNNGELYFLDKTPRYYLIIPEILKLFPEAKFIFLFRNPVQVYSSIISSFGNNRLRNLHSSFIDLKVGPKLLAFGYKSISDKAIAINYEDLVTNPDEVLIKITNYLKIDYSNDILKEFANQDTKGIMGDTTGVISYKTIETKSIDKWKKTISNSFRKKMIYNYAESLEEEILKIHGYDKTQILNEFGKLEVKFSLCLQDRLDYFYSFLIRTLRLNQFFSKSKNNYGNDIYLS